MRVAELSGPLLDYWVARAEGKHKADVRIDHSKDGVRFVIALGAGYGGCWGPFSPSTNWAQGGPLIDKYDVAFLRGAATGEICAFIGPVGPSEFDEDWMIGPDRLIAAFRAIVQSVYGDEVPDE